MVTPQGDNIQTIVKAAGVTVEPYWPGLFAKLFEKRNIADLITNVGAGESVQRMLPPILCVFCLISAFRSCAAQPVICEESVLGSHYKVAIEEAGKAWRGAAVRLLQRSSDRTGVAVVLEGGIVGPIPMHVAGRGAGPC